MKKLYWSFLSASLILVGLIVLFSFLNLVTLTIITTIIMLACVIVTVVVYIVFVKFRCPKCNTIFKGKWWEVLVAPHSASKRYMKCPLCNEKVWSEDYFESKKQKTK